MLKRSILKISTFLMLIVSVALIFVACGKVEFKVNFVVDDEVYATINTSGEEVIKMPIDPAKEGYIFDGWYFDENDWQKPFTANSLLDAPLSSNMSIYAKWTPIEYTAMFKADGQTVGTATYTIEDSKIKNIPSIPNKNGYDGTWESYTLKVGDITVNAVYTVKQYSITYSNTKGVANTNKTSYTIETEAFTLTDLSKEGYTFDGWYDGSTKVTKVEKGSYGNLNLEAKWTPIEYTAMFKADGQTVGTATYTIEDSKIKNIPSIPNKNGYDGTWESYELTTGNKVVNAVYTAKQYSITYSNTKGVANTNKTSYTIETEAFTLTDLSKEGYTFDGWYDGSTKVTKVEKGSYGNLNLEAKWTPIEYTATFKADGQTVGAATYTIEDSIIKNIPAVPNKNGYDGTWENYTIKVGGITINVVYTIKQYSITWENYDGTILRVTKCEYGETPSFGNNNPTRKRDSQYTYTFSGWSPGIVSATEDTTYIATHTKTLCTLYEIKYDANGGLNEPSMQTKTKGYSTILSTTIPTNEGYVFMGWACAFDGKTYSAGSSFSVDANVTLYAVWGNVCETCNGNGVISTTNACSSCSGSGRITTTSKDWVKCSTCSGNGTITFSYNAVCSSCNGWGGRVLCECSCGNIWWADQTNSRKCSMCGKTVTGKKYTTCSNCNGSSVEKKTSTNTCPSCSGSGGKYASTSNTSVCSVCGGKGTITNTNTCSNCGGNKNLVEQYNQYTVTLKDDNSNVGTSTVKLKSPYKLSVPSKNGYTFLGWFDADKDGIQYTDCAGVSLLTWKESNNKTLYAHWSINYYTITYDCDPNADIAGMPTVYTVEDANIDLKVQNRDYYTFEWELNNNVLTQLDTSLAQDVTIKGIWTPIEYALECEYNGGVATNNSSYNVETDTFSLINPVKVGYTFIGWTGSNGSTPQKNIIIEKGRNGNLSFIANWCVNQYTITFNSNGGSSVDSITQDFGTAVSAPTKPTLEGKSFVGWFDSSLTTEYTFSTIEANNITLYAKWIDYEVTLTCDKRTEISVNDLINADTFSATAVDTDGNSVEVTATVLSGTQTVGSKITVRLVAMGLYDIYATETISNINIYGNPTLTYNTEKDYINMSDTINASLFSATAVDTLENAITVNVSVKEDTYKAGDVVTIVISATDKTGNETKVEITNVKVYGTPTITRNTDIVDIKATDTIGNDLFGISAVDSFGVALDVTTIKYSGTFNGGNTITIKSSVTDSKGNSNYITYSVKVYGLPSITNASTTNFKVEDEITLESLGITAKDSFANTLTDVTLELTNGSQIAGATLTYLVTATDHLGNVNTKEITGIKIYGTPTITFDTEKTAIKVTDTINSSLFSATAKDSFDGSLSVNVTLNSGTLAGGNVVTFKLSTMDALGNTYEVISQDIKVYSSDDITLTYTTSASNMKKSSKGEEFNATATNSFGETCATSIEVAEGFTLAGGNTINLYIVATDIVGNTTKSDLISGIKVYDTPTLSYARDYDYIQSGDSPESLFKVVDSFNKELLFDISLVSGAIDTDETVTYNITAKDRVGNVLSENYELTVLKTDESILELYKNGEKVGTQRVYKGGSFTLPYYDGYDVVWYYDGTAITDNRSVSLSAWDKDSNGYIVSTNPAIITYSITYNLNGGTNNSNNPTTYTIEDSITLQAPTKVTDVTTTTTYLGNGNYSVEQLITAYTFLGWFTDESFENAITTISGTGAVVLYASWSENTTTTTTTTTIQAYSRDGSYIYFGSYPQTKVTDSTISTSLSSLAGTLPTSSNSQKWTSYGYYISGSVTDYMWYIDVEYSGAKYRGVYFTSYRPYYCTISSSSSNGYQYTNGYYTSTYWFKYEPIKWQILEESNGYATILADLALDSQQYDYDGSYSNNYANSTIRAWLNDTFYNTAFNDLQKALIQTVTVDNSVSSTGYSSNSYACSNTNDKVWLLSYTEAFSKYFSSSSARTKKSSDYAKSQGCWASTSSGYEGNCSWWLRSPNGYSSSDARYVICDGDYRSYYVYYTDYGVVPALKIKLS